MPNIKCGLFRTCPLVFCDRLRVYIYKYKGVYVGCKYVDGVIRERESESEMVIYNVSFIRVRWWVVQ